MLPAANPPRPFTFLGVEGALIDGEWHIRDVTLAERLGLERVRDIRQTIERNMEELKMHGSARFVTAPIQSGKGRITMVKEYYLNQSQVLLIAMLGRTEASRRLRADMIRVYNEWYASGMPAKVCEPSFWRSERRRLGEERLSVCAKMSRARAALATAERRVADAAAVVARLEAQGAKVAREYEVAALVEAEESGVDGAGLFASRLASLSIAASVFLLIVEEPAELSIVGGIEVPEALRAELARRFGIRLSIRAMVETIAQLKSFAAIEWAGPFRKGESPSFFVTSIFSDATEGEIDAMARAVRGAMIDPVPLAEAILARGQPDAFVGGKGPMQLAVAVVAALVQAGVNGLIDAGAIIAAGLSTAVAGRRKTLEMRDLGSFLDHGKGKREWFNHEMEGRRIDREGRLAIQAEAGLVDQVIEEANVPDQETSAVVMEGEPHGSCGARVMSISKAVVTALRAHPAGLARAEIPDAASAVAGVSLNQVSVMGQLQRMRTQGLIVRANGRWCAADQLPGEAGR